jgi:hypothetical protein
VENIVDVLVLEDYLVHLDCDVRLCRFAELWLVLHVLSLKYVDCPIPSP